MPLRRRAGRQAGTHLSASVSSSKRLRRARLRLSPLRLRLRLLLRRLRSRLRLRDLRQGEHADSDLSRNFYRILLQLLTVSKTSGCMHGTKDVHCWCSKELTPTGLLQATGGWLVRLPCECRCCSKQMKAGGPLCLAHTCACRGFCCGCGP